MPSGSKPSLFISSTCYDLSQVRADLKDFIESIGMEPILSEFDSFPVNPNQNNLSNCLNNVKNRADIFILVVGGRYGSITDTGKSITNLEYYEAKSKGIPKYVFIKENILALLPIWKENPDANYKSTVDNTSIFKFIIDLRESGDVWVFPFSNAQSIVNTLRQQLSYLFSDCLDLRAKIIEHEPLLSKLEPKAFKIVIEKNDGWEFLLFAQILSDMVTSRRGKRLDVELGISFGEPVILKEIHELTTWVSSRFEQISTTIDQLTTSLNRGFIKAVGKPGEPGDIERIIHLATRIGDAYEHLLDWNLQFFRVICDEEFKQLISLVSRFSSNAIQEIEEFSASLFNTIERHIHNDSSKDGTVISLTLTLTVPDTEPFIAEISRLKSLYHL